MYSREKRFRAHAATRWQWVKNVPTPSNSSTTKRGQYAERLRLVQQKKKCCADGSVGVWTRADGSGSEVRAGLAGYII